jgi:RHS repeat-associated protein
LQSEVRTAVVVQTPELLVHDLDGNLVRDGRWLYSWDAENRLVRVTSWGSRDLRRVDWTYDAMGRRVRQVRYVWTNSTWQVVEDLKLVSDSELFGRHIAELNGTNGAVVRSYVWGLDVSETLDGAGGVGGSLWLRLSGGPAAGVHFVTYDGNGNVWNLVSASTGTETARYEYGLFGEPLRLTGSAAGSNPFQFSTKRTEDGTGLVLYEYRAYSPALGRWLSRDPIEERGGLHLYAFVRGDPIGRIDPLGLEWNVLKCMQWCNEAVTFCQPIGRTKAAEWWYECCLDVGP